MTTYVCILFKKNVVADVHSIEAANDKAAIAQGRLLWDRAAEATKFVIWQGSRKLADHPSRLLKLLQEWQKPSS